jgi:hypothetical protein
MSEVVVPALGEGRLLQQESLLANGLRYESSTRYTTGSDDGDGCKEGNNHFAIDSALMFPLGQT